VRRGWEGKGNGEMGRKGEVKRERERKGR